MGIYCRDLPKLRGHEAPQQISDMSLLDGLVLDGVLNPPVVKQEIWLAIRADGATGAGTEDDPYDVSGAGSDTDPRFDRIMRAIGATVSATAPMTIRLQPGVFFTRGYRGAQSSGEGWTPTSGMRIVGSGVGVTTLKMVDTLPSANSRVPVVGSLFPNFLEGFELSDLSIDANYAGNSGVPNLSVGGIYVNGRNVFIRRIDVTGIGQKGGADLALGICAGVANSNTPETYNCVVEACSVRLVAGGSAEQRIGILIGGSGLAHHRFCVIRDCYVDMGANNATRMGYSYFGIEAADGIGTIVENNQILNSRYGIVWKGLTTSGSGAVDTVIRQNNFINVGIVMGEAGSNTASIGRIIILNNSAEWPTTAYFPAPIGVTATISPAIGNLIARGNLFRRPVGNAPNASEIGLAFQNCTSLIVENNVADVGAASDNAVRYSNCTSVKAFNNKKADGTFVAAYNTSTLLHLGELTTDVEDALLAI